MTSAKLPYYEVVIRVPAGVSWAGPIKASSEEEARRLALKHTMPERGQTLEVNYREHRDDKSILG